jgi:hypothetical protein
LKALSSHSKFNKFERERRTKEALMVDGKDTIGHMWDGDSVGEGGCRIAATERPKFYTTPISHGC